MSDKKIIPKSCEECPVEVCENRGNYDIDAKDGRYSSCRDTWNGLQVFFKAEIDWIQA